MTNILITGDISGLSNSITRELLKDKPKIVLASLDAENQSSHSQDVIAHLIDPASQLFTEIMSPYRFDVVFFLSTREEQTIRGTAYNSGKLLDGLKNTLELCRLSKANRFVYVSSLEVYGESTERDEAASPDPKSVNGHMLLAGEQCCKLYWEADDMPINIVRVPYIYSPNEENTLVQSLLKEGNDKNQLNFPASGETVCNLLHADDAAVFLHRLVNEPYSREHLFINLVSSDQMTFSDLQGVLSTHFPGAKTTYDESRKLYTGSAKIGSAKKDFDWLAVHEIKKELPVILESIKQKPTPKTKPIQKIGERLARTTELVKWLELIAGAGIMHFLNNLTGTLVQFRFVDFRLLYVILLGSLHGIRFGLLAAFLASLSILYSWYQSGLDWAMLLYNVENWLPIAMYLVAGAATGYQRDKKHNEIAFQEKQLELMDEKYGVLYEIYNDIAGMKDKLREQLLGYRDSFGRIFRITQDLETFQEDDIFLRALGILEEFLSNKSIAIYTMDQNSPFARLVVNSQSLNTKIGKSLNLKDYPKMSESLDKRMIFQNTDMLAKYPAYAAPVFNDSRKVALVVIWEASLEQYSMYFYNLVKVISGLIQSSLVRAALFNDANEDNLYLPSSKVLASQTFKNILDVKLQMRNNRIADFKLLEVETDQRDWKKMYDAAKNGIRSTDYIGQHNNGLFYILLSQANSSNTADIIKRLAKLGIRCRDVDESEVLYV